MGKSLSFGVIVRNRNAHKTQEVEMKTLVIVVVLLTFPAIAYTNDVSYLLGCGGKSCIELLNESSVGGGAYGQPVADGGNAQNITIMITENELDQEDDLYHINTKSVKFSGDVKFSGRRRKSSGKQKHVEDDNHLTYSDGQNDAWAGKPQRSHGGPYSAGFEDGEARETNTGAIINREWDTRGQHYSPAGGGNAWRDDGTFMQKAGGGYIDTKRGQHVPAN